MNTKEFNNIIIQQIDICKAVLIEKGLEYAPSEPSKEDGDRLSHFKKAAAIMNVKPKAALLGMLSKHIVSVSDMCMNEGHYTDERWNEKITDCINYLLILRAIVEEENFEKYRS